MTTSAERLAAIEQLFRQGRESWRDLLRVLDNTPELGAEDPWEGLDDFVASKSEELREEFTLTLREMILHGEDDDDRALALAALASTRVDFDLGCTLEVEQELSKNPAVHVEWILAVGQRNFAPGREVVERALKKPATRHAAAVAFAQLAPSEAGEIGREMYLKDREEVRSSLKRPLGEHDYATFFQMTEAVLEVAGKEGVNVFLRAIAGDDGKLQHEMAEVAARLLRQQRSEERLGDS